MNQIYAGWVAAFRSKLFFLASLRGAVPLVPRRSNPTADGNLSQRNKQSARPVACVVCAAARRPEFVCLAAGGSQPGLGCFVAVPTEGRLAMTRGPIGG